jgi:H+/gluconate symporter-like permease
MIVLGALVFLILVAYRGYSVILFAPVAAMGAVLLTDPQLVAPMFTGLFMEKLVGFLKLYFPVFVLGAVFGKLIEVSGFSRAIVEAVIRMFGPRRAVLSIVLVSGLLTYGGVSLFVVVFAVYPFAAGMFRQAGIPKRLIPATLAVGGFSFTMDALPGSPQIQNIIPTTFFGTDAWAAPVLGCIGGAFVLLVGLGYVEWRCRVARRSGEGYGAEGTLVNEPQAFAGASVVSAWVALLPLLLVFVSNKAFTLWLPHVYGSEVAFMPSALGHAEPVLQAVSKIAALWAVEAALLLGILSVLLLAWRPVLSGFAESSRTAVSGALLAAMNTASEYGFGAVIAALPGFMVVANALGTIKSPLLHEAVTITGLAAVTGSASGGMSLALAAMAPTYIANAEAAGIPMEVLHRVAAMASGGMDSLPHNGAVITLLMVTGLTHRQAYKDIFAITLIKTLAAFVVIGVYSMTGWS